MKILVSDLDGTIFKNGTIDENDINKIIDFAKNNIFIIATGRDDITYTVFNNFFHLPYEYVILCNGALIKTKENYIKTTVINNSYDLRQLLQIIERYKKIMLSMTVTMLNNTLYIQRWDSLLIEQILRNMEYGILKITMEIRNDYFESAIELYNNVKKKHLSILKEMICILILFAQTNLKKMLFFI